MKRIASISEGGAYTVFNPSVIKADDGDFLSVYDSGDMKLKTFTPEGNYLMSYGKGRGGAPGQVITLTDAGVWEDSLVFLVDPRQRRVSFFNRDGDFVRAEKYDSPIYRVQWATDSIKYEMPPPPHPRVPFMRIETPNGELNISRPPVQDQEPIMLDGTLHTIGRKAIFVMRYIPAILIYSLEDTSGTAYPTPDYGRDLPRPREGELFNATSTLSGGVLSVGTTSSEVGGIAFDLYNVDTDTMEYLSSIRFPIDVELGPYGQALYAYGQDLVVTVRDTTVTLYRSSPAK